MKFFLGNIDRKLLEQQRECLWKLADPERVEIDLRTIRDEVEGLISITDEIADQMDLALRLANRVT